MNGTMELERIRGGKWQCIGLGEASDIYDSLCAYYPDHEWPTEEGKLIEEAQSYDPMGLRINFLA